MDWVRNPGQQPRGRHAPRTRPVPSLFQRRVDRRGNRGSGARRRVRRASALVDDLLDQRAARRRLAGAAAAEDGKIPVFHRRRKVDWIGGLLLMASAMAFMLVLTWGGNRFAWLSPAIAAMLGSSFVLAAAFVWHARATSEPFLPLSLMGGWLSPTRWRPAASCSASWSGSLCICRCTIRWSITSAPANPDLALIPLAAISTGGAALAGRTMMRAVHYKRVAIIGTLSAAVIAAILALVVVPLWLLLALLSLFAFGLGTTFPICVVSLQNAVARPQVGTVTGAMNFFRALGASFTVAAFTAILLMALGADVSIDHDGHPINGISAADLTTAFHYVFAAAAVMLAGAALFLALMEERPLAGPAAKPALEMVG